MRILSPHLPCSALLLASLAWPSARAGELAVIVNPRSDIQSLSRNQVVDLFLGRQKFLAPDTQALPFEQANPPSVRARFYRLLVNKDLADIASYWARLLYSGQAQPPRQSRSSHEVIEAVAANPGAIGVVDYTPADLRVRIVFRLSD